MHWLRKAILKGGGSRIHSQSESRDALNSPRHSDTHTSLCLAHGATNLPQSAESSMTKLENRCACCGGKFGLIRHNHWGLRFCRKACKERFFCDDSERSRAHKKVVWTGRNAEGSRWCGKCGNDASGNSEARKLILRAAALSPALIGPGGSEHA